MKLKCAAYGQMLRSSVRLKTPVVFHLVKNFCVLYRTGRFLYMDRSLPPDSEVLSEFSPIHLCVTNATYGIKIPYR
jgi:hypothetical protein